MKFNKNGSSMAGYRVFGSAYTATAEAIATDADAFDESALGVMR
jgi:hypothetical protein